MQQDLLQDSFEAVEDAKKSKDYKGVLLFGVSVVMIGVVAFCEILYVGLMLPTFPDGIVRLFAIVGAAATGLSALILVVGKLHWFSRGKQSFAAWAFVIVEVGIMILNVLLAVQTHYGDVASWLQWWNGLYAAAPISAFVGWGGILFLDIANEVRSRKREEKDRQITAELQFESLVHKAHMNAKYHSLKIVEQKLTERLTSGKHLSALDHVADEIMQSILVDVSGKSIPTLSSGEKVVESSFAQTSTVTNPPKKA